MCIGTAPPRFAWRRVVLCRLKAAAVERIFIPNDLYMKLKIKNLGAVKEIILDLDKPLSVFCGQNGTGKTWVGYAVWAALHKNKSSSLMSVSKVGEENLEAANSFLVDISLLWDYLQQITSNTKKDLTRLFSIEESNEQLYFGDTEIELLETFEEFQERILNIETNWEGYVLNISTREHELLSFRKKAGSLSVELSLQRVATEQDFRFLRDFSKFQIYGHLALQPISDTVIFPVERSAIFSFGRELTTVKKQFDFARKSPTKFSTENITTIYPEPIEDAIDFSSDLIQIKKIKSEYYDFAVEIETELLNGKVSVSSQGIAQFSPAQSKKIKLSVHQSSSIVKSLLPLVVYLKHRARKGDLIIIDEPELNLHPANQITLVRVFARLIHAGLRLLISTHSDYIIREINNLIMIADGSDDVRQVAQEQFGYDTQIERISAKDIGVYMFQFPKGSRKAEVTEVKPDESGFAVSILDDTIAKQSAISDELFYTLNYGKAER